MHTSFPFLYVFYNSTHIYFHTTFSPGTMPIIPAQILPKTGSIVISCVMLGNILIFCFRWWEQLLVFRPMCFPERIKWTYLLGPWIAWHITRSWSQTLWRTTFILLSSIRYDSAWILGLHSGFIPHHTWCRICWLAPQVLPRLFTLYLITFFRFVLRWTYLLLTLPAVRFFPSSSLLGTSCPLQSPLANPLTVFV